MPFTTEEFFSIFAAYNQTIWPLQVLAYIAGLAICLAVLRQGLYQTKIITGSLAVMWSVNGIGYHWLFFSQINPAAYLFAALFLAQAILLLIYGFAVPDLSFKLGRGLWSALGIALVVFSMVLYPAWGWVAGHRYPATPVFGVAPCPTTIFTIGVLLLGNWQRRSADCSRRVSASSRSAPFPVTGS